MLAPGEVAECGSGSHRAGQLYPTQGLERVDDRGEPPGLYWIYAFVFQTRQPFGVVGHRADVFVEHALLRRGGTHHFAEPPEGSGAPGGLARRTDIVPQEKGLEPKLRGLQITDDIFTRPAQVPKRFILHLGHVDRGEVPRASQAGQFASISAVSFAPIAGLFGDQRGRDDPADLACFCQVAVEPIATRAGCIDKDKASRQNKLPVYILGSIV